METSSAHSGSFILAEKVKDLESKLSQAAQVLKTKENVVRLQQEQIKRLEAMYKKCSEDAARVTSEHKKTVNDLENLRIILNSYERRKLTTYNEFGSQVDLIPPPCREEQNLANLEREEQIAKTSATNAALSLQHEKSDYILAILQTVTNEQLDAIRQHIENLEVNTENILSLTSLNQALFTKHNTGKYKIFELENIEEDSTFLIETGSQTNLPNTATADATTNIPVGITSSTMQAAVENMHVHTTTYEENTCNKETECLLNSYSSVVIQNTIYDDICLLKASLPCLQMEMDVAENLYDHLEECVTNCHRLVECVQQKDKEILELKQQIELVTKLVERCAVLTIDQVKQLCKDVTLQTGEEYMIIIQENGELKAKLEMLSKEISDIKSDHSEFPRVVVELSNKCLQTIHDTNKEDNKVVEEENYRQKVVELSLELTEAYSAIKGFKTKIETLERDAVALEELKEMFRSAHTESTQLYKYQLSEAKEKHEHLLLEIKVLEEQLDNKKQELVEWVSSSTQVYGWAPIVEQTEVLRVENNQLTKSVFQLREELELTRVNHTAMKELEAMCLKLGQQVQQEAQNVAGNYLQEVQQLRQQISGLRADNKQLSDGVQQLNMLVRLDDDITGAGTETCASSEITSSNECIHDRLLTTPSKDEGDDDSSTDIEQLKCLCQDLTRRLKHKKLPDLQDRFGLLASLEDDLRVLTKEFLDFKWTSQHDHENLMVKHSELQKENDDLINCLKQYKTVNERLLQSHYELEKAKTVAANQHQDLVEEYLKLQDKLEQISISAKKCVEHETNTILLGKDIKDVDQIKIENVGLVKYNRKLRQEVDNLLTQVNDQHVACMQKLQANMDKQSCAQCESAFNTLQTISVELKRANSENSRLIDMNIEKDEEIKDIRKKYNDLDNEKTLCEQLKEECEVRNEQLIDEIKRLEDDLRSVLSEKEVLRGQLDDLSLQCKHLSEELCESKDKAQGNAQDIEKYQEEINMLQNAIAKIGLIKEKHAKLETEVSSLRSELKQKDIILMCNDALKQELHKLQDEIKDVTDLKDKVETDFESYIRTNNLLQQTINAQNANLSNELKQLVEKNTTLCDELQKIEGKHNTSKTELVSVVGECAKYKIQLEQMAQRIDIHMREHLEYKRGVDEVKRGLQAEIGNLKHMLDEQNKSQDTFEINNYLDENGAENLKAFINAKELEIDYLMGQKMRALEVMGQMSSRGRKDKCQTVRDDFRVQLNFKKVARDLSAGCRSPYKPSSANIQPRSSSVPRTNKTMRKNEHAKPIKMIAHPDVKARPTVLKKQGSHLTSKKK